MNTTRRILLAGSAAQLALLGACATTPATTAAAPVPPPAPPSPGEQLAALLDRCATDILRRAPERSTGLGVTEARAGGRYIDRLGDNSKAAFRDNKAMVQRHAGELRQIDRNALSATDKVTYDVVLTSFENQLNSMQFEIGGGATGPYVLSQLQGAYVGGPDFMDNRHPLQTRDHVTAYMTRLERYATALDQDTEVFNADTAAGVIPPDFALDKALSQLNTFAAMQPQQTVLVQSLVRRLPSVNEVPEGERAQILSRAETIVRERIMPAYQRQIAAIRAVRPRATHDAGVWKLQNGEAIYAAALRSYTTTSMTPDQIHQMGLDILRQTQGEMDQILRGQGMRRGTVAARVRTLSRRRDQLYPNTDAGRAQILADLNKQTDEIIALMPRVCGTLARARLEIRRVPVYTQAGAPGGYYQRGTIDGSRPGAYYINLRDTAEWPKFTLPTLNYHEGVPGHHWQGSIQQEAGGLPFIRSALLGNSAFGEGWGLYAEQLADELDVYATNPLGRLGYLQSMAFRASRLVVDTGIHAKRWSREQAIRSMMEATGDQESSVVTEIERYSVRPGQACAYMVGKQEILRLRQEAQTALTGTRFEIREFHDTVLTNGSVPLSVLERIVRDWVAAKQR